MNEFQPFEHEVMASQNEKEVDYNLSESGVHPLLLRELLTDHDISSPHPLFFNPKTYSSSN
jgi:hypothetical protein